MARTLDCAALHPGYGLRPVSNYARPDPAANTNEQVTTRVNIRKALDSELDSVLAVERDAFESDVEAALVAELLRDPTAQPTLSLLALQDGEPVGHVLFSKARVEPETPLRLAILAPLAVARRAQRQGIGGALIRHGLEHLTQQGVAGVFVLGDPGYYTRHGFTPALPLGLAATHAIPPEYADAWMVRQLHPDALRGLRGRVLCSEVLSRPEYWV